MIATLCVAGAATIVPVVTAAPAQASITACQTYLHDVGYKVGPKITRACSYAGDMTHGVLCHPVLVNIGVKDRHASTACRLAIS
ncbi:hypothetical protein [Streptomyces sp. NPDC046712]|uniref:hypothetical protein n=1 Tax=Streptomyces sp. NPDC046712 TaxID=3154802 RepID=UPI003406A99E